MQSISASRTQWPATDRARSLLWDGFWSRPSHNAAKLCTLYWNCTTGLLKGLSSGMLL